ncbi:unnamed protein product [Rotaria sordida]|uniref:RNA-directed DNA polymerase n=1 Tax=Rotaria sordida TaxID=392033 RepID=A0A815P064_9BILA|nr:unnamed protein product [Rotaria sordida]CAF3724996.1 unnamed protein product [Rotaria sordida]
MEVLVDTGATNSIIQQSSLSKIQHQQFYPIQHQFFLANKTSISIIGYVTLEIKFLHIQTYVTAAVTKTLCCDVILGEDWIKSYQVTINRFKDRIEILGNKAAVPLRTSFKNHLIPVKLQHSISIPPRTKQIVEAFTTISTATKVLFSPDLCLQARKKIFLTQEFIRIQNYLTKLAITNTNDLPIYLSCDTNLGFISFLTQADQVVNEAEPVIKNLEEDNNKRFVEILDSSPSVVSNDKTSCVDHDYQFHKRYKSIASQLVPETSLCVNTINNSTERTLSIIIDIEKTLDQVVQHIIDLQKRIETRQVIQRYRKVFDTSSPTIALTSIHHTIPTGDHPPINSVPYRGSLQQQQALKKIIVQLERSNQIRPSSSPWSSPVLLIKKKDGDYRFVVDYRKLNSITTKDSFPIPTIESTLQQLAGNCYFSKLDLRSGYFQIPINENDKPKTAFITTTGLWEFNVLPMGLTNAPPSFQRTMYNLIVNGREQYCLVYLDDIIIFSKTFKDHLNHLDEILNILDQHRFQLNPIKCSLMKNRIDYLGHSISEHGITPLHDNIKAIRELHLPDYPTLKQANEFIGGLGFYRKFIKNFSKIAAPIHRVTNLTKHNKHNFKWGEEQRQAIQQLKEIITGPELVLDFPNPDLPYILSTDASKVGLGAVLKQVTEDGGIKIIYYLSRVLSNSESRYSTTELEALAMVWAITKLRPYLLGKDFKVETDHCPLCQFHKKKSRNGRLDRWSIEILSEYNITEIKYKKGKCHCDADLLSRYPLYNDKNSSNGVSIRKQDEGYLFPHVDELNDGEPDLQPIATINVVTRSMVHDQATKLYDHEKKTFDNNSLNSTTSKVHNTRLRTGKLKEKSSPSSWNTNKNGMSTSSTSLDTCVDSTLSSSNRLGRVPSIHIGFSMRKLKEEQMKDKEIHEKIKNLVNKESYEIIDGIIHKLVPRGKTKIKLPWIPKSMINQVLFLYHDHHTAAHLGSNKTSHKLINKYYWPNMHRTINNYIQSCMKCSKYNYTRTKRPGKMNITPTPNQVMSLAGMDYWGPTNQPTARGNRYVITITDYLSKFVFARAVKTNSAQEAADFFLDVCYHYGAPAKLITDQGPHFVAELTRTIIESCNTTHILATPYHPTSNAQTERFNATFAPALSKLISDQTQDWDDYLQPIIYAYNTSKHATTTLTPFHIMFTRENQLLMDPKQLKVSLMKPNQYYDKVKHSRELIINHVRLNIQRQNRSAKSRYDQNRPDPKYNIGDLVLVRAINRTSKFQEKYEGPYRVIAQKGPSTFIVKIEDPDSDEDQNYTKQVTTADLKHVRVYEDF